ncbi:MAG: yagS [Rhodoferax sp.]|nr:yagS [Rhodoferax sp.]
MNHFNYVAPRTLRDALAALAQPGAVAVAGGTNLLDLMKENVATPATLVDVNALPLAAIEAMPDGGLRLGALARNADTAHHPLVRARYPLLSAALLAGASPQIRNMATNGGNLLQRTRCYYFYDTGTPCNKRSPGSGCPARNGLARMHAVLGASVDCVATHPSDMCVALAALGAVVHVASVAGERGIAMADFHRLPGATPHVDNSLAAGELITHITLPPVPEGFGRHAAYLKLRERASYAFALVSVAALLDIGKDGTVSAARIALGGVAHKPWRDEAAEQGLVGRRPDAAAFEAAAACLLRDAVATGGPTPGSNAFKIPMARRAVVRALQMALQGQLTNTGELALHTAAAGATP